MNTLTGARLLGMLTAGAASWVLISGTLTASAVEYHSPADYIFYDADGNAYCKENNQVKTGKFSLQPNYLLGDTNANGVVDGSDAKEILLASAFAGIGASPEDELNNETYALLFADIDGNGQVNSIDAARILTYVAGEGAKQNPKPLGFNYYYADENGFFQKGFIKDAQTGETYFADDNYHLVSGWKTIDNIRYYFDDECTMASGVTEIDGNRYYFDENGIYQTGLVTASDGNTYYLNSDGIMQYGQQTIDGKEYYFSTETGAMTVSVTAGWTVKNGKTYYINENGTTQTGWLTVDGKTYYLDASTGERLSGWQKLLPSADSLPAGWKPDYNNSDNWTQEDWSRYYLYMGWDSDGQRQEASYYYFSTEDFTMQTGWLTLPEGKYYLDADGRRHTGTLELDGKTYQFDENGLLTVQTETTTTTTTASTTTTTTTVKTEGTSTTASAVKSNYDIPADVRTMLDNAKLTPGIRHIDVKNRQNGLPYTTDPDLKNGITLTDKDYQIIEKFAAEHFTDDMTLSERLYVTWWWIHCNVDYAYAGTKWNTISGKSYVDAVFNYKLGQCVQYNGAMAAVLAYYGFDVYMVKGWVYPETKSGQHYWTEVMIDGKRYYVETGNRGKNGDKWQYFFIDAEKVDYTATP